MATTQLPAQVIELKNYGDDWINHLAQVENAFAKMDYRERQAALEWLMSKYKPK